MSSKQDLIKIASIVRKQQKILSKLAQQVIDTSRPNTDPLGKVVHDATTSWATQNRMSASSNFNAGTDGKSYEVDVTLTITDPKKPMSNTPNGQKTLATFKQTFTSALQAAFSAASNDASSELFNKTATFNVTVK